MSEANKRGAGDVGREVVVGAIMELERAAPFLAKAHVADCGSVNTPPPRCARVLP